ncbi:hypothetical protein MRS44_003884 [Fusarium solani]|uniref:uncharacterized protein n=1 Tax=Fusarium solani TaxID=169388 RepID=UPI0032C3F23F|nr:hypothetical protein MRS44_003884 [Fusarium solani]
MDLAHSSFSRRHAFNQNLISGAVLFFTIGIYLAVLGLGAGGGKPSSQRVSDISNSLLYGIFAIFGFLTGAILNRVGPRITMSLGVAGYPLYVAGLFYYDRTGNEWFPVLGGAILGLSAPMLWSTSGFIQWAYASEGEKGKFIAVQYFIGQIGSVVGSLVAFIIIYKGAAPAEGSPTNVYIAFIVLMMMGFVFASLGLIHPSKVLGTDGSAVAVSPPLSLAQELREVAKVLRDHRVLLMLPVIFSCELALGILPSINARFFSLRTRAMNNVVFCLIQLPTSVACAYATDNLRFSRRVRGYTSLSLLGLVVFAGWIALLVWITVSSTWSSPPHNGVDWKDAEFAGPFILYLAFGIIFCAHQLVGMWVMGTFSNRPRTLAIYGGLWKGVAAAGVAVQFGMGAAEVSYRKQIAFATALQFASIPIMFWLVSGLSDAGHTCDREFFKMHAYISKIDSIPAELPEHNFQTQIAGGTKAE